MIFPPQQFVKHGSGLWYTMPVLNDKHSDKLVFYNSVFSDVIGYKEASAGGSPGGGTSRAQDLLENLRTSLSSIMQKN